MKGGICIGRVSGICLKYCIPVWNPAVAPVRMREGTGENALTGNACEYTEVGGVNTGAGRRPNGDERVVTWISLPDSAW